MNYTKEELAEFDRITLDMSSHNQLTRINARLELRKFEEQHGIDKMNAMFAELMARDKK